MEPSHAGVAAAAFEQEAKRVAISLTEFKEKVARDYSPTKRSVRWKTGWSERSPGWRLAWTSCSSRA